MKITKFISLTACLLAINSAQAAPLDIGELGISNHTSSLLSFAINQNCSSEIGNITGYNVKAISLTKIIQACSGRETCEIVAYDNQNCFGDQIGGVRINFNQNKMEVFSLPAGKDLNIGGSINLYQYNIFFDESRKA